MHRISAITDNFLEIEAVYFNKFQLYEINLDLTFISFSMEFMFTFYFHPNSRSVTVRKK